MLFNDPQFIEAARVLAAKLVTWHPTDDASRVGKAFRILTGQTPDAGQLQIMTAALRNEREACVREPSLIEELLKVGEAAPPSSGLPQAEVAATAALVRALMAYDEVVMKP